MTKNVGTEKKREMVRAINVIQDLPKIPDDIWGEWRVHGLEFDMVFKKLADMRLIGESEARRAPISLGDGSDKVLQSIPEDYRPRDMVFKAIVVGNTGVGKTCFGKRFCTKTYCHYNESTIGAAFLDFAIPIFNLNVKFQVWDTAGQESFAPLVKSYYRNAAVAFLCYDVTSETSFRAVQESWMPQVDLLSPTNVIKILIGTKLDEVDSDLGGSPAMRGVSTAEAQEYATKHGVACFREVSSRHGKFVEEAFLAAAIAVRRQTRDPKSEIRDRNSGELKPEGETGVILRAAKLDDSFASGVLQPRRKPECC
jgi:Ras-related protein Rab-1A